jgi:hypothetical protein
MFVTHRYRHGMDRFIHALASLAVIASVVLGGGVAVAAPESCAARYPEAEWTSVSSGPVAVEQSGIASGIATRFKSEVAIVQGWLTTEVGPVAVSVCLVGEDSTFDRSRYLVGSQQFHAVNDLEQGFFAMDTSDAIGVVAPALAFGLTHHALYQNNGAQPFPQPLADTIAQWYRGRILERLPYYHRTQLGANWFESEAQFDWTADGQQLVHLWDPDRNDSSIGDFIDFAVEQHGTAVLLETDGEVWSSIEGAWRSALRVELTGRTTPTTGWIIGAGFVLSVGSLSIAFAGVGMYRKRRRKPRPPTAAPIEGFFTNT